MAVFDTAHRDLYVACTGDSRAVAGIWQPGKDGEPGTWRVDVLSEDQTGRNPSELKRSVIALSPFNIDDIFLQGYVQSILKTRNPTS